MVGKFDRHSWNKSWRDAKKRLEKAIRQHKKRSHIRAEIRELDSIRVHLLYGGIGQLIGRCFRKSYRKLEDSYFAPNPIFEKLTRGF